MHNLFVKIKNLDQKIIWQGAIFFLLLLAVVLTFLKKTDLSASDLGRHLENGRVIFSSPEVLRTNFYSFTEPNHVFINHHWLSGLIFRFIYSFFGFSGLHIFNIFLACLTFSIFFYLAHRRIGFQGSAWLSLPVIFLLSKRFEIRPEIFSYLFLGLTWFILERREISLRHKMLYLFPLFILWANLHIYFFLGLALVFFWLFDKISGRLKRFNWSEIKLSLKASYWEISIFFGAIIATLFNPNHVYGLIYPFNILRRYGYDIAENQSIFFFSGLVFDPLFELFKLMVIILFISLVVTFILSRQKEWFNWLAALIFSFLAFKMVRNLSLFSLVWLVLMAGAVACFVKHFNNKLLSLFYQRRKVVIKLLSKTALTIVLVFFVFFLLATATGKRAAINGEFGLGLRAGSLALFDFLDKEEIIGPIFNNYDAGSALIFWSQGREKVFVDNRPEAYSVNFFQDIYIPMQSSRETWMEALDQYKFKTIIFSHKDSTPWSRQFLAAILFDERWPLVYFDQDYVVLINKLQYAPEKISRLMITPEKFRDSLRFQSSASSLAGQFALANLAELYRQPYLAEEIYRQIIFKYPFLSEAYVSLGYLYSSSSIIQDLPQAIYYLKQGQAFAPYSPKILSNIGFIYWRMERYLEAEKVWRQAVKKIGRDKEAENYLQQVDELRQAGSLPEFDY